MHPHRLSTFFSGSSGGEGSSRSVLISQEKLESLFTAAQLHELQTQILFLKHKESGYLLPLPIRSCGCKSGICHPCSCLFGFSYKGYNSRNMMDSEPGRCRRTDGKKWRCYKSVVKDQKYCERHMHRGRQHSRKLVEGLEHAPKSDLLIADTNTLLLASANTCGTAKSCDNVKASILTNSEHAPPASGTGKTTSSMVNISSISRKKVTVNSHHSSALPEAFSSHFCKCKGNHDCEVEVYNPSSCYSTSASIKAAIARRHLHVEDNGPGSYHSNKVTVISSNNHFKEGYSFPATPACVVPQESPPQDSPDANRRNQTHYPNNETLDETEDMRCKRTDGKQWRCSHEVVHGQKYCEKHMHRGAKKVTQISNPPIVATTAPSEGSDNPFFIAKRSNSDINLNMDPSPSIIACAMTVDVVNQSTSSSSDATTISD